MYYEVMEELHDGRARICRAPEEESYFAVYGDPEGYTNADGIEVCADQEREEIIDLIDRDGLWYYFAQVRCACCGQWETVDSIGMVIGSLDETGYRDDFLTAINERIKV